MKWYVLQFTTTRFAAVFPHLEQHNFSYYCPMISEKYRRPDKQISFRERLLPLFPGYLFIQADFEKFTHLLSPHPLCSAVYCFGGEPLPVPDDEMADFVQTRRTQAIF
jgi:transcriptional antiterminator RfaH